MSTVNNKCFSYKINGVWDIEVNGRWREKKITFDFVSDGCFSYRIKDIGHILGS